jgi:hypothetical protein
MVVFSVLLGTRVSAVEVADAAFGLVDDAVPVVFEEGGEGAAEDGVNVKSFAAFVPSKP